MPIHDRIYARLEHPPKTRGTHPALGISRYTVHYILKGWPARLGLFGGIIPVIVFAMMIYVAAQNENVVFRALAAGGLTTGEIQSFAEVSGDSWYRLGANFVSMVLWVGSWVAMFMTAIAGAGQIADDMRSHAFEVYLARPMRSSDYVLGKLLTVMKPVLLVTLAPALLILLIGHVLLPDSLASTLSLYPRVILLALIFSLVNACAILGISSLGKSSRYATIIWFVLNLGTFIAFGVLTTNTQNADFELVSYTVNHYIVAMSILDTELLPRLAPVDVLDPGRSPWPSIAILATISFLGLWMVSRRSRAGRLP